MAKKLFLVGDFKSNTGPAIANKALKKALGKSAEYSCARTRVGRMVELIREIMHSQVICFCGFSEINVYGVKLAKCFGKKTAYLMHGYVELEAEINRININPKRIKAERYLLGHVDKIICVSNLLAEKVKTKYLARKKSIYVVYDIVEPIKLDGSVIKRNKCQVISTGGGMPQKNNLIVCEAIKKVNSSLPENRQLRYVIIGNSYGMEETFAKYGFVQFLGNVSHKECLRLMQESALYIQNSSFDTFGMAIIEAAGCGCDLIISSNVGAKEIIDIDSRRIIDNNKDVSKLSNLIECTTPSKSGSKIHVKWDEVAAHGIAKRFLSILEA